MKIKAVVFPRAGEYETAELTAGRPKPEDITVKTLVSAISPGTERWILRGKHIGTVFPCVPGYHRIGVVESCGKNVSNFRAGDLVYGCANSWKESAHSMWGAHVSGSVGAESAYKFLCPEAPCQFELETTAFTVLAGVALRGVKASGIARGEKIAIIGGGFIGLCAAQLAEFAGAEAVIIDNDPGRVDFARQFARAFSTCENGLADKLGELAPEGFDVLHDTAGAAGTTNALIGHMRHGGRILLQAQYFDRERCAIDLDSVKVREITIKTTCGVSEPDWRETFELIRSRTLKIGPLITHRFSAADALKGYRLLDSGSPFNMGIVFDWS